MTQVLPTTRDAMAQIQGILNAYGLNSLANWAWDQIVNGASAEMIQQSLRERPEFLTRFAGMTQRRQRGLPAISPNEYLNLERQYLQLMRGAGLPQGFYDDPTDFADFIGRDVSINEAAERINLARDASFGAPPEVRQELETMYGITEGDLVAYWIDPDRALPLIQRKFQSAQASGIGRQTGYGALTAAEGETLATQGTSTQELQQGFSALTANRELYQPLDAGEQTIGREEQLGAQFLGNAPARQKLERQARRRVANFEQGGQFAGSQQGYGGLG